MITVALLGCSTPRAPAPIHPDAAAPAQTAACKSDGDCVLVDEGCCGCTGGGKRIAMLRSQVQQRNCEAVMCPQIMSNDPSCLDVARAYCKAGRCEISSVNDAK